MLKIEYIICILFLLIVMLSIIYFLKKKNKNILTKNKIFKKKVTINDFFIKANGFTGYKKGYVFKNDTKGLGYYKDNL